MVVRRCGFVNVICEIISVKLKKFVNEDKTQSSGVTVEM